MSETIPAGLCHCGCGKKTIIARKTRSAIGHVKGQPLRYVLGHQRPVAPGDDLARLRSKLVHDESTGCLNFQGRRYHGYGMIAMSRKPRFPGDRPFHMMRAHRAAWLLAGREIPPETPQVLHRCDNPSCCNLDHLFLGTNADNQLDKARKQRGPKSKKGLPFGTWQLPGGRWASQYGRGNYLGTFDTWQEAAAIALYHKNLALYPDLSAN